MLRPSILKWTSVYALYTCTSFCPKIMQWEWTESIWLSLLQNLISTVIVAVLSICGAVSVEKLSWKLIRVWLPVNLIFVGMLVSGMFRYVNSLGWIISYFNDLLLTRAIWSFSFHSDNLEGVVIMQAVYAYLVSEKHNVVIDLVFPWQIFAAWNIWTLQWWQFWRM